MKKLLKNKENKNSSELFPFLNFEILCIVCRKVMILGKHFPLPLRYEPYVFGICRA
jgi:hypothetical protein